MGWITASNRCPGLRILITRAIFCICSVLHTLKNRVWTGYLIPDRKDFYLGASGFFALGCAAQTCEANSLSRSISYRCFISSIELPTSGPGLLKTHAQTEQAQPQNRSCNPYHFTLLGQGTPPPGVDCGGRYHGARRTLSQASAPAVQYFLKCAVLNSFSSALPL